METVIKDVYVEETVVFENDLMETVNSFTVEGQKPDRSIEDRDVYFSWSKVDNKKMFEEVRLLTDWLKAEDAIVLGELLIKHGRKALVANMVHHQLRWAYDKLKKWIRKGKVKSLIFTAIDEHPADYGDGHVMFDIKPVWKKGKSPKFYDDFHFEMVIYWSPLDGEFSKQIKKWKVPIQFIGYDHDEEVSKFKEWAKQYEDDADMDYEDDASEYDIGNIPNPERKVGKGCHVAKTSCDYVDYERDLHPGNFEEDYWDTCEETEDTSTKGKIGKYVRVSPISNECIDDEIVELSSSEVEEWNENPLALWVFKEWEED